MCIYTIYKITNTVNNKSYIGFDSDYPNRIYYHKSPPSTTNTKFARAVRKYGWNSFTFEIIYQSRDWEHTLNVMEPYFIREFNSFENGYNSTLGGEGTVGRIVPAGERIKISEAMRGNTNGRGKKGHKMTDEQIESMSQRMKGNTNSLGKTWKHTNTRSTEHSDKIRNRMVGNQYGKQNTGIKQPTVTCPHCSKEGGSRLMVRYHFDNCKLKK